MSKAVYTRLLLAKHIHTVYARVANDLYLFNLVKTLYLHPCVETPLPHSLSV